MADMTYDPDGVVTGDRRVALVTGGGKGIGGTMVHTLLSAGHAVVAADSDATALADLAGAVDVGNRRFLLPLQLDLTAAGAAEEAVAATARHFGGLDILVNNAGIGMASLRSDYGSRPVRFWEVTPEQWRRFLEVNTTVAFALSRAAVPIMRERGFGRIVNITTSLGTMLRGGFSAYGASKAAFEALSAVMAEDLAGSGITVNVLVPGGVTNTAIVHADAATRARMLQPEVMVPPLLWLVSDAASGTTGRRFLAAHWDAALPPEQAAERAGAPTAWGAIASMPIEPAAAASTST